MYVFHHHASIIYSLILAARSVGTDRIRAYKNRTQLAGFSCPFFFSVCLVWLFHKAEIVLEMMARCQGVPMFPALSPACSVAFPSTPFADGVDLNSCVNSVVLYLICVCQNKKGYVYDKLRY